jgi:hypothetical protein
MKIANVRVARLMATLPLLTSLLLPACGGGDNQTTGVDGEVGNSATTSDAQTKATRLGLGANRTSATTKERIKLTTSYYVDALAGDDANFGTAAALPWKSLAKLQGVTMTAGGAIYLRCGSVWRETLELSSRQLVDGTAIAAYGGDCNATNKPRISAADSFTGGWTKTGAIWSRKVAAGLPKIMALNFNGVPMRVAQWPNFQGVGQEYALTAAGAAAAYDTVALSAADRAVLVGKDVAGAAIQLRSEPWLIEPQSISALDASGLKLRARTNFRIDAGDGFVLQDKLWMLDAPGEFFHDVAAGTLHLVVPGQVTASDPNIALVEGTVRDVALVVSGRSGVSVTSISLDMARTDGVTLNNAPGATLDGVDAFYNLSSGVRVNLTAAPAWPTRGAAVKNGRFVGNGDTAIDAGNGLNVDLVSNVATQTGMHFAAGSNAALVVGDGGLVQSNVIDQVAGRGILFSGFGGTRIVNNTVSGYCLRLADCAAIYTYNGQDRQGTNQTAVVEGNRVTGGTPNVDGTSSGHLIAAIYLDDLSRSVTVRNNALVGMPIGIFLHNASNSMVEYNKVWLTTDTGLFVSMDNASTDLVHGNLFRGNQLVPSSRVIGAYPALPQIKSSQAIRFHHAIRGQGAISSGANVFAGNQVVAFNGDTSVIADIGFTGSLTWLNAAQWTALNPAEPTPASQAVFATHRTTLGPELLTGGNFDAGLGQWTSWFGAAAAPGSAAAVDGGDAGCVLKCVRMIAGTVNDRLSTPIFNMVAGAQYKVSYIAAFSGAASIAHANIARPQTPFDSFVDAPGLRSTNMTLTGRPGEIINYEAFFTASSSDAARINLRVETPGVPVMFDSVSLRAVVGYEVSNFADWGVAVSAPANVPRTVGCSDLGWPANCVVIDVDGLAVAMPLTVSAGNSRLLLLSNSAWRVR